MTKPTPAALPKSPTLIPAAPPRTAPLRATPTSNNNKIRLLHITQHPPCSGAPCPADLPAGPYSSQTAPDSTNPTLPTSAQARRRLWTAGSITALRARGVRAARRCFTSHFSLPTSHFPLLTSPPHSLHSSSDPIHQTPHSAWNEIRTPLPSSPFQKRPEPESCKFVVKVFSLPLFHGVGMTFRTIHLTVPVNHASHILLTSPD